LKKTPAADLPLPSCLSWLLNIYRCINPTLNIWCLSLVKLPTTTCKLLLTHKCILNVRGPNPSSKNPISAMRPLLLWCGLIFYLIMRRKLESFIKNSIMGIGNKEKQNQRIALVMYPGGGPAIGCWSEASSIHSELIPTTVTASSDRAPPTNYERTLSRNRNRSPIRSRFLIWFLPRHRNNTLLYPHTPRPRR